MKDRVEELQHTLQALEQARQRWKTVTHDFILAALESWVVQYGKDLDLIVEINDAIIGHETITLAFRNVPTGLTFNDDHPINQQEGKSGNLIKYGATLNFSFVYLGDVITWMTYPYIRDILENTEEFIDIARSKPETVNAETIHSSIDHFLAEVNSWHAGKLGKQQRIGFTTSSTDGTA